MKLITHVDRKKHIQLWLKVWNGGLQLTDKEFELVEVMIEKMLILKDEGVKEPYLSELLFSTKSIAALKSQLNISKQGYNNYKKSLIEKGVFELNPFGINPRLIPQESLTFEFVYDKK